MAAAAEKKEEPAKLCVAKSKTDPTFIRDHSQLDSDVHHEYEFGGPVGTLAMMFIFPTLLYYMWTCLVVFDGKLQYPPSLSQTPEWTRAFARIVWSRAAPTPHAAAIYLGFMAYQMAIAIVLPGYKQEGQPITSLKGKKLMYNCNGVSAFYTTCVTFAALQYYGYFDLAVLIDEFGPIMSVAIISGFGIAGICYFGTLLFGHPIRMSGNHIYDYFMGASLNPRVGPVDIKMWAEVRVPWMLLFLISIAGCIKQKQVHGFVAPNLYFMVMASGLQLNACAKGEDCIPQTWDMTYEKFGWLLSFWNFAGVPFSYCYSVLWMATHDPSTYRFSTPVYVLLFGSHILAHIMFDTAMAQKSHFKMQIEGQTNHRKTFPQWPGNTIKNPKYIQCANGGKLLISGWWAYLRKPNYTADIVQIAGWSFCTGFPTPIVYWYITFFLVMIVHRVGRDFTRCQRKYGKDWDEYRRIVPYIFIPYVF